MKKEGFVCKKAEKPFFFIVPACIAKKKAFNFFPAGRKSIKKALSFFLPAGNTSESAFFLSLQHNSYKKTLFQSASLKSDRKRVLWFYSNNKKTILKNNIVLDSTILQKKDKINNYLQHYFLKKAKYLHRTISLLSLWIHII